MKKGAERLLFCLRRRFLLGLSLWDVGVAQGRALSSSRRFEELPCFRFYSMMEFKTELAMLITMLAMNALPNDAI